MRPHDATARVTKLTRLPNEAGMDPVSSLSPILMTRRLVSEPSSLGMGPLSRFVKRSKDSKEERFERAGGMGPVRPLEERSRWSRYFKLPSWGDIDPPSDESERLSPTTWTESSTESDPHVTPLQVQKFGLLSDHPCKAVSDIGSSKNDFFTSKSTFRVVLLSSSASTKIEEMTRRIRKSGKVDIFVVVAAIALFHSEQGKKQSNCFIHIKEWIKGLRVFGGEGIEGGSKYLGGWK